LGGLFVDVFVVYVFKVVANWVRGRGSNKWPSAYATVTATPGRSPGYGGTSIEVVYSYRFKGELYTGIHEEPILFGSAEDYAARFTTGTSLVVRVKPGEPEVSIVREKDQAAVARTQVSV